MSISGNLRTMPFADLLQWLSQSRKSGTLVVEGDRFTKKLLFDSGELVAVASENPKEFLGYYLVGWGLVEEDELQELLDMQDRHNALLGELLVIIGRLSREEFEQVLQVKIEETVYDLFLWDEASFRFLDGVLPDKKLIPIRLPVDMLIFEGVRRKDEFEKIRELVPDARAIPRLVGPVDRQALDPGEAAILDAIDGERSVERVALACKTPTFNALYLVSKWVNQRLAEVAPPPEGVELPIPGFSASSWLRLLKESEAALADGDVLAAYRGLRELRQKYSENVRLRDRVEAFERQIEVEVQGLEHTDAAVPELAIGGEVLTALECGPEEGFLLSRIDGHYTLGEIKKLVPSTATEVDLMVATLVERGVLRLLGEDGGENDGDGG